MVSCCSGLATTHQNQLRTILSGKWSDSNQTQLSLLIFSSDTFFCIFLENRPQWILGSKWLGVIFCWSCSLSRFWPTMRPADTEITTNSKTMNGPRSSPCSSKNPSYPTLSRIRARWPSFVARQSVSASSPPFVAWCSAGKRPTALSWSHLQQPCCECLKMNQLIFHNWHKQQISGWH